MSSFASDGSQGFGLARSSDGGATWKVLASDTFAGQRIRSVVPTTLAGGNVVLVATLFGGFFSGFLSSFPSDFFAGGGVYRSTNNGETFTRISGTPGTGLPDQGVSDLVADPSNPSRFYAAVPVRAFSEVPTGQEGIYRSDDSGLTWAPVTAGLTGLSTARRILLAVHNSPGNDVLYAAIIALGGPNSFIGDLHGMFRSTDLGNSWTAMGVPSKPVFLQRQGGVHGSLVADASNPNVVFLGGDGAFLPGTNNHEAAIVFRGDASVKDPWTSVVGNAANGTAPHADTRSMVFDANGDILRANDGGIYRLIHPDDPVTRKWVSVNGNIRTVEFHSVAYDPVSNIVFGGTQDNGTIAQTTPGSLTGEEFKGADGGDVAVDSDQTVHPGTSIRYSSAQLFLSFNRRTVDANNVAGHPDLIRLKIVSGDGQGKDDYTDNVLVAGTLGRGAWTLSNPFAQGVVAASVAERSYSRTTWKAPAVHSLGGSTIPSHRVLGRRASRTVADELQGHVVLVLGPAAQAQPTQAVDQAIAELTSHHRRSQAGLFRHLVSESDFLTDLALALR